MLLYLVRHAMTRYNETNVVQGSLDSPLSPGGQDQARLVADHLRTVPFTQCWSSPQRRAVQTAHTIIAQHPHVPEIRKDDRLTARDWGDAEGRPWDEVKREMESERLGRGQGRKMESDADLIARLMAWLTTLIEAQSPTGSPSPFITTPSRHSPIPKVKPGAGFNRASSLSTPAVPWSTPVELDLAATAATVYPPEHTCSPALPRPMRTLIPTTATASIASDADSRSEVVLVVTHQECLSALLSVLLAESRPAPASTLNEDSSALAEPGDTVKRETEGTRARTDARSIERDSGDVVALDERGTLLKVSEQRFKGRNGQTESRINTTQTTSERELPQPQSQPKSPIDVHIPNQTAIDPATHLANTAISILSVWWEEDETVVQDARGAWRAKGRIEIWGDDGHLAACIPRVHE